MGTQIASRHSDEEEDDVHAIARLWQEALKGYKGVVGRDLTKGSANTQAMIDQATNDMKKFHKFRHDEKKVDKLRTILIENFQYIEAGTQQITAAASSSFPPAAAIGVALTYFMTACRQVSADYDTVTVFFEDMKSFLQRITILEARLPKSKHYRVCLLDVFASFLVMCGFAQKFVELGRFKKWISNLLCGEDSELADARKDMDLKISRLQNATENAILGNTEEQIKMTKELEKNNNYHTKMLQEQLETMKSLKDTTDKISEDISKLLKAVDEQRGKGERERTAALKVQENEPLSVTRIRNILPPVHDEGLEYRILKETIVDDTCCWVFSEPQWRQWYEQAKDGHSILAISGASGLGKSHISATVHDKLTEEVAKDTSKTSCVAQFYFREHNPHLSNFLSAIASTIIQVAKQSSTLCELFNAQWQNDEIQIQTNSWQDLVRYFLIPAFKKNSQNYLFVVLDGIDELENLSNFTEFAQILQKEETNISLLLSFRPDTLSEAAGTENLLMIHVTIEKQSQDLRALIWRQLNSLAVLRTFSRYVQQRIADRVEATAPKHILTRFNCLGREGAVLRILDQPLPKSLNDLYHEMLQECYRRTAANYHKVVTKLIYWVAYSFRPLTLREVTSLTKLWAGDESFDLADIPEPLDKFIRIGDLGADAEARAQLQAREVWAGEITELQGNKTSCQPDSIFDDSGLLVKFKERSLRSFFRETLQLDAYHLLTSSQACRIIFLDCSSMARLPDSNCVEAVQSVKSFAVQHLLEYWKMIKIDEHSMLEQAEVMEAIATIMRNEYHFAAMVELQDVDDFYTKIFSDDVFMQLSQWAALLDTVECNLSKQGYQWWTEVAKSPLKCLWHLSKAHVQNIFRSADFISTKRSFNTFKDSFQATKMHHLLVKDSEEIQHEDLNKPLSNVMVVLGLEGLFDDVNVGASGYRALTSLLLDYKEAVPAKTMCQRAIEKVEDAEEKVKIHELMARIHIETNVEKAYGYIIACVQFTTEKPNFPLDLKRKVLITKARIEVLMKKQDQAAESYHQARNIDATFVTTGDILAEEIGIFTGNKDKSQAFNTLMKWRPLERLAWMTWDFHNNDELDNYELLQDVAIATNQIDPIIRIYNEAIAYLDTLQAGAPLRIDLGFFYLMVCDDAQKAKEMTDEVLNSRCSRLKYPVTEQYVDTTLESAIELQSQANYILFRDSDDPTFMSELLNAQEGLLTRPLAVDVPPESETFLFQRHLTLSRMYRKMGPAIEFQNKLQGMIDTCIDRLSDKVGWNDSDSLTQLATTLSDLSQVVQDGKELSRVAQILVSARFSALIEPTHEACEEDNKETDDDTNSEAQDHSTELPDEGNLADPDEVRQFCVGICKPRAEFVRWGSSVGYQCLTCYFCFLCQECYDRLGDTTDQEMGRMYPKYCEKQFGHIKGPIEGWKGVRKGMIELEGEEPMPFRQLLQDIQHRLCKEAWKDFWKN
ncbi:hypothetical protein FPCIR_2009 [Fusarium pseudocircinatum]|uniref:Fungal STAND N-terminal Goodbye domain-containing protein n=1 Tax=Fusarium pseudocircinatum TaxID=56676 RepID=A0A8H5UYV3_9HYPO|nr:hypothetical protein FPCIR_2009 [Fusarium pseudocircinatum]